MIARLLGLRLRLTAALVLTAAVTLAFAAFALLSPLKERLRRDSAATLLAAVGAARPLFEDTPRVAGKPVPGAIMAEARTLERRSAGRVALLDANLNRVYDTDTEPDRSLSLVALRSTIIAATGPREITLPDQEIVAVQPLRIGGARYFLLVRRRLAYVQQASRVVRDVFLKAAAVGLAVALLLGIALSATLLRRLERLRDAARQLDQEGLDASRPPHDPGRDEIGDLARAFASMHGRLRRQEDARRSFVATASHELRTPLASLDGMLELLSDDLTSDPVDIDDARERVARAKEQSRRLAHLAADLLDLSRLDAAVDLRSEPIELAEVARAVAAEFELRFAERGVQLRTESPRAICWASGDPGSVARIVRILLDNALRVAPRGSMVMIAIDGGKRWVSLEVRDQGPGVPEDERKLIFDRFQRGSRRSGEGGFGLGLAIGQELAVRMGGALELVDGDGPGATFGLRLRTALVGADA